MHLVFFDIYLKQAVHYVISLELLPCPSLMIILGFEIILIHTIIWHMYGYY